MALPAIHAITRAHPGTPIFTAGRWGPELYEGLPVQGADVRPDADVGVFFKPSLAAAARWRHVPRRVGIGPRPWLTHPVERRGEHRRERYGRIAAAIGVATPLEMPRYHARGRSHWPGEYIGLNPWSPTETVRWPGFAALAGELAASAIPMVFFAGPGEESAVRQISGSFPILCGLSLPDFAATLAGCRTFVSNDSGAAHFAAACGTPVVMVHGSTGSTLTGVGHGVEGGPLWCRPCYRKRCWWGTPCLGRIAVPAVRSAVALALAGSGTVSPDGEALSWVAPVP